MLVSLRDVGRTFQNDGGKRTILKGVDLTIAPGESIAIMGSNGVGKSTLASIIGGLDQDFDGEVRRADAVSKVAPTVFQDYRASLLPWLSIEDNIAFPLTLQGVPKQQRMERVRDVIARAPNRLASGTPVSRLSGGQAQLCCILRALVVRPRLLICDEPFSAIDFPARMELRKLLSKVAREDGVSIIFVSHNVEDSVFLADTVVVLEGRPARITKHMKVEALGERDEDWLDSPEIIAVRKDLRDALSPEA